MSLTLRPATVSDAHELVDVYLSAFAEDPIAQLCFPRNKAIYDFWYNMIVSELADPNSHYLCITTLGPDSPSKETIIAFSKWNTPSAPISVDLPTWPEGGDVELANKFFGGMFATHRRLMEGRKHWYLELIATRPEFQGKGAAGMLMRWGLEKADEEGVETYLEASPAGKPIYEHFGFQEVDRLVHNLEGKGVEEKEYLEVIMVRPVMSKN